MDLGLRGDDYIEVDVPAVWHHPGSNTFYSIYDSWYSQPIDRINEIKTAMIFGFPVLIGLVFVVAHLRLHRLGVRPIWSANPEYRRRQELLSRPGIYATVVLAASVACGFVGYQFARSNTDRDFVAEALFDLQDMVAGYLRVFEGMSEL